MSMMISHIFKLLAKKLGELGEIFGRLSKTMLLTVTLGAKAKPEHFNGASC